MRYSHRHYCRITNTEIIVAYFGFHMYDLWRVRLYRLNFSARPPSHVDAVTCVDGASKGEDFDLEEEEGLRLTGLVVGLSVYNGIQCDVRFPPVFYKQLLGRDPVFRDLATFDSDLYDSLNNVNPNTSFFPSHLRVLALVAVAIITNPLCVNYYFPSNL
jgi:hypothetical protein